MWNVKRQCQHNSFDAYENPLSKEYRVENACALAKRRPLFALDIILRHI